MPSERGRETVAALTRGEKLALAVIITVAALLRFEGLAGLSLSHFDEGIYVASGLRAALEGPLALYPTQPLYSPPLFPWLVAALCALVQYPWPTLGVVVSAALGTATVPLTFAIGRRMHGTRFGLAAAGLLAASDFHTAFSRMALTDAPVTFWFTLAIYCAVRLNTAVGLSPPVSAKAKPSPIRLRPLVAWAVALGLTAAAAWNTKYNGWMPLAIIATAAALSAARSHWRRTGIPAGLQHLTDAPAPPGAERRLWLALVAAAALALLAFLPWYVYVDDTLPGGYRAVSANHASYFGGPARWAPHAWQLFTSLPALRHWGWLATLVALTGGALYAAVRLWPSGARTATLAALASALALGAALIIGADAMLLLLAAAAILPALAVWGRTHLILAVWIGAFLVLTPLYHPYVRLLLPALPGAILLTLALCLSALRRLAAPARDHEPAALIWGPLGAALAAAWLVALVGSPFGLVPSTQLWQRWTARHSYREFGDAAFADVPPDALVICQGQPLLWLYVPRQAVTTQDAPFTTALTDLPPKRDVYLAADFWIHEQPQRRALAAIRAAGAQLQPIAAVRNDLNIVTLLDWLAPREVARKLSSALPPGPVPFYPQPLRAAHHDVILLYKIAPAPTEN